MTMRRREIKPVSPTEAFILRIATIVVSAFIIFGILLAVVNVALDIPDCPVTIHPNETWSPIGWSVAEDGALWCELNPDPQPGQPHLMWDYTWKVQQ